MKYIVLFIILMQLSIAQSKEFSVSEISTKIAVTPDTPDKIVAQQYLNIVQDKISSGAKDDEIAYLKAYALGFVNSPNILNDRKSAIADFRKKNTDNSFKKQVDFIEYMTVIELSSTTLEQGKRVQKYEELLSEFPDKNTIEHKILYTNMIQQYSATNVTRMKELCDEYIKEFPNDVYTQHIRFMQACANNDGKEQLTILNNWPDKNTAEYLSMLGASASFYRTLSSDQFTTTNQLLDEMIARSNQCTWTNPAFQRAWCYKTKIPPNDINALLECRNFITSLPNDQTIHGLEIRMWLADFLSRKKDGKVEAENILVALENETWWIDKNIGMSPSEIEAWIRSIRGQIKQ